MSDYEESLRLTLKGAEIGEVVVAMESQYDYYVEEIYRIENRFPYISEEDQKFAARALPDLKEWRDACKRVLVKIRKAKRF